MNMKNILQTATRRLSLVIGVAALALAAVTVAQAQERVRVTGPLINTNFGTAYYLTGGSNVMTGMGLVTWTGGTNSVTLTNAQAAYSGSSGVPVYIGNMRSQPFYWDLAGYAAAAGTSNTVAGIDLSSDGTYWTSNSITATLAMTGTSTNESLTYFPATNGVNVLSGWQWARWSYASTAQLTNVTLLRNQFNQLR
jgi:hypothetical protein